MGAGPRGIGEPAPRPAPRVSTPLTTADRRSRGGTGGRWARLPGSVVQVVAVPALASPASPAAGRLTALSAGCGSPCGGPPGRTEAPRPGASPARQRECSHGRAGPRGLAPWENERQPPGKWLPNSRPTKQWENVYCCFKLLRFISFP